MPQARPYTDLLRSNPDFSRLWVAQLISFGGDWFAGVALLGLTLELTGSSFYSSLILAANMLPFFLLAPITGVIADRVDRKRLMVVSDLVRAVFALGLLLVRSSDTVWIGIASLAAIAFSGAFFGPASQAALPNLVTPRQLGPANVLMGSSWGTMLAVGAALGGILASVLGRDAAFVINSFSFLASALLILRIKGRFSEERPEQPDIHPVRDLVEGIEYARSDRRIKALLATKVAFGLGAGTIALLPLFATQVFDAGDTGIGLLFAARGVGVLLGPFGARAFVGESQRRLFAAVGLAMTVFAFAYAVFPLIPSIWFAAPVAIVAHLGGGAHWILSSFGLQKLTPDRFRGRISSFDHGLVTVAMATSMLVTGRAAEFYDPRSVMQVIAGVAFAFAVIWALATRDLWSTKVPIAAGLTPGFEGSGSSED